MGGLAAAGAGIAILLAIAVFFGFLAVCLVRLAAADRVRLLPKWVWAVLIVCVNPVGGALFLLSQLLPGRSAQLS
jgi:hypothetical protein